MQLAFSNAVCPDVPLEELADKARAWGCAGVEVCGVYGQFAANGREPDWRAFRKQLQDAGVALVALNTGLSFGYLPAKALNNTKALVRENIALAAELGCPDVVVSGAALPALTTKALALGQTGEALGELALDAAARGVTLLIENGGALADSADLWFVQDAGGVPALRVCWNAVNAVAAGDTMSRAIPRLAATLNLVHLSDARLRDDGRVEQHVELGAGDLELPKLIELLKGVAYSGWVCLHWPRSANGVLPPADQLFLSAAQLVRAEIDKPVIELSAYKGDKNAPRFAQPRSKETPAETP